MTIRKNLCVCVCVHVCFNRPAYTLKYQNVCFSFSSHAALDY